MFFLRLPYFWQVLSESEHNLLIYSLDRDWLPPLWPTRKASQTLLCAPRACEHSPAPPAGSSLMLPLRPLLLPGHELSLSGRRAKSSLVCSYIPDKKNAFQCMKSTIPSIAERSPYPQKSNGRWTACVFLGGRGERQCVVGGRKEKKKDPKLVI